MEQSLVQEVNQQERLEFDIGWLVGVWESEGWFSLRTCMWQGRKLTRYRPEFGVTNTDNVVLENVERILKRLGLAYWRTKWEEVKGRKSRSMIRLDGVKRCARFIQVLEPYIVSKRDRLNVVKRFIEYRMSVPPTQPYGETEHKLFAELRELNAPLSKRAQNPQRLDAEQPEAEDKVRPT